MIHVKKTYPMSNKIMEFSILFIASATSFIIREQKESVVHTGQIES